MMYSLAILVAIDECNITIAAIYYHHQITIKAMLELFRLAMDMFKLANTAVDFGIIISLGRDRKMISVSLS